MRDKKTNGRNQEIIEPDRFANFSDEELIQFVKKEGAKDASVLAKLIIIQRIRTSLVRERLWQRIMTGSAIVLSILGLIVGVGGWISFDAFLKDRDERTATGCRDDAKDAISINANIEGDVQDLYFIESFSIDPVEHPVETAFIIEQVDMQVAKKRSRYLKVRDCTEEGISEYNRSEGQRGYLDGPQVELAKRPTPVDVPGDD